VSSVKVQFKKSNVLSLLADLFQVTVCGKCKNPTSTYRVAQWRSLSSLVVLQCTSTLNSREWKSLHLILHPFLHSYRSCPKNTRTNASSLSSAVGPDTLIDLLLYFNVLYSQRTSRTPIIVY